MSRPMPKKSALAGSPIQPAATPAPASSPADPPASAEPAAQAEPTPTENAAATTETEEPPKAKKKAAKEKKPAQTKTAFYQDPEAAARMRAAYIHTLALEDYNSLSAFIAQAVDEKVRRLESKYNEGHPWKPVDAGNVPTGRPPQV